MLRRVILPLAILGLASASLSRQAFAQRPGAGVGGSSSLGSPPGSGANPLTNPPSGGPISGRLGASGTHVLSDGNLEPPAGPQAIPSHSVPSPTSTYTVPSYRTFATTGGEDDDGPLNGLTLDQAIDLVLRENLDLKGKALEIPQSQADILSASLRANPIFYADGQLVPYSPYTKARPGGQTQYDVNVSFPLDLSHKRSARTRYATQVKRVIEAQYQDAVRNAIDQIYTLFVNVLAARQTVRYSRDSVNVFTKLYTSREEFLKQGHGTRADLSRLEVQRGVARVVLLDAEEGLRQAKRDLAVVLNIPACDAERIEVRGSIQDTEPPPPPLEELIRIALEVRPDVISWRLGIKTAEAGVVLQTANRTPDWYLLYQPYTFQDNSPVGLKSPTSWALGITAPILIYNRNQGAIARANLNVTQSQIEAASAERQAITEVENAYKQYRVTATMVERIRDKLEPAARQVLKDSYDLYVGGAKNQIEFLDDQREYSDTVKLYTESVVRHRRAMLALNTMVGIRVFP